MDPIPYGPLHIYYLSGRLTPNAENFAKTFLGNWEEEETSFLFFSAPAEDQIEALLAAQPHLRLLDTFQMSYEQWQGGSIEPLTIAGVTLRPPWTEEIAPPAARDGIVLTLDPGLVFGSGTHPTTADCLRAIREVFADSPPPDTVLDLGTGTGVLALAAAKLGSRRVLAVDLNPLAAHTAKRNIAANGLGSRVLAIRGRAEQFADTAADLLVANIHYEVLEKVMAAARFKSKPRVVLSGLLRSEARAAKAELEKQRFRILETWETNDTWSTILAASGAEDGSSYSGGIRCKT